MDDFKEIVRKAIEKRKVWGDPNYIPKSWWASLVNRCNRESYYRKTGIKSSVSEMNYFRLVIGDVFHSFLQDLIEESGVNLEPRENKKENKYLNVTAKVDNRITYQDKDCIIDYKTVSNFPPMFYFDKIKKANEPRKEDVLQLHCNFFVHKKEYGLLVYLNMEAINTGNYKDFLLHFPIKRDQKLIDYVINKFLYLNQCIQREIVPEMEPDKCKYCGYKYICEGKPRRQKKILKEKENV